MKGKTVNPCSGFRIQWHEKWVGDIQNVRRRMLCAVLVDPRQATKDNIADASTVLGMIEERYLEARISGVRAFHQGLFWETASEKLHRLRLDSHSRARLESEIMAKVPKPGPDWPLWAVTCIPRYDP